MIQIKDLKSNDFAYLEGKTEGQVLGSVKGAFRYIISLSNMTGTYIDDWDSDIFKSDGKWLTDKGDINKVFFARKAVSVLDIPGITPELAAKLETPLKAMFNNSLSTYKNNIERLKNDIASYYSAIHTSVASLKTNTDKLMLAEIAAKTKSTSHIEVIKKVLNELPVDLWLIENDMIGFICKTDTIVPNRDKINKINRSYNLGRLIFKVTMSQLKVTVERRDIVNRWVHPNHSHFHYGPYLCAGGFGEDFSRAQTGLDLYELIATCLKWKDTYDGGSTLTSTSNFNHHPAFTTYEPDDFLYGKSELDLIKQFYDQGFYYCDPMIPYSEFSERMYKSYNFRPRNFGESYRFAIGGGPRDSQKYERDRPLDTASQPWTAPRYSYGQPSLNYGEHREWLALCRGKLWSWIDFSDGDIAPTPPCGVYDPLFADTGGEEGGDAEWISADEYNNRFDEYPEGHDPNESEEDEDR